MDILDVEGNLNSELISFFKGAKDGFVQVGEKKWFYPKKYRELADEYKNFEVRSDDIWITGYPRSGTTLTEELTWLLSHDLDFGMAKKISIAQRVKFFEGGMMINEKAVQELSDKYPGEVEIFQRLKDTLKDLSAAKSRRVIKTHLPFELLPEDVLKKGCKVIYVCRYPKDVSVSYFYLQSTSRHMGFSGDFKKYWEYFRNGNCSFGPYFEHVKQGFEKNGSKNFLFVFYEDFRKDKRTYIKKLSDFLECSISESQLKDLEDHTDFEKFQKAANIAMNNNYNQTIHFVRKGNIGGWRDHFTEEMNEEADKWIEECTKKIGLRYPQ